METYLTPQEVAERLRCSRRHAARLINGLDSVVNIGTGKYQHLRIPESSIANLLTSRSLSKRKPRRRGVQQPLL